jgi:crossover junction endodeoxyribonuclease RuvC
VLVLGIDPGIADTGFGVVRLDGHQLGLVDCGNIRTPTTLPLSARLQLLDRRLAAVLATHRPPVAALEELFFNRNVRSAMDVGQARGVTLLCLANAGVVVHQYTPLAVKSALTGYGRADKGQMLRMVRAVLNCEALRVADDAIDALAIAICHVRSSRVRVATGAVRVG